MAVRILFGALALVAAAWIATGLHRAVLESQGTNASVAAQADNGQSVDRAAAELRRAAQGNPDTEPLLGEAFILSFGHRDRAAATVLEEAVRREPENAYAWGLLQASARTFDPRRAAVAAARFHALDPLGRLIGP